MALPDVFLLGRCEGQEIRKASPLLWFGLASQEWTSEMRVKTLYHRSVEETVCLAYSWPKRPSSAAIAFVPLRKSSVRMFSFGAWIAASG
jgi:hypothetical protein